MLKFISLGSGSSGNSYLLKSNEGCILIDAGINARTMKKHFKEVGLSLDDIDAIFVTHDHADHIKALCAFTNDMKIPVHTTELVHRGISRNHCLSAKICPDSVRFINKGETFTIGDMKITPFEVPHDSSDCVGYSVVCNDVTFCLITDAGHVTPLIEQNVAAANYLVLESNHDEDMLMMGPYSAYLKGRIRGGKGHLSNKTAATLIAEHATPKLRHVWLCHLSEENNHPELARKTVESVLRSYGIIIGTDFYVEILKRKAHSGIYELT
ncbi:MAG: MBL fold metallo-hydrolase [Bacteroidaceae bacterium]|nr:MBL fold metallo-hydrolase [Bacteroidaceae bacterium]